jgi:3-oxoacyl-[acyl-carrier protein] reductase
MATAMEYARRGIRVNCVRLGPVRTAMTDSLSDEAKSQLSERIPLSGIPEPEEVAPFIVALLDDAVARHITGSILTLDGGFAIS